MADLQFPVIHLNGTSKKSLIEELDSAYEATSVLMEKLALCNPNMRDYYPLKNSFEAFTKAQNESFARINKVREIQSELEQLVGGIETGGAGRE